jgi:cell division protein FtsN
MARSPTPRRTPLALPARPRSGGGTLLGVFIGLALGILIAGAVALYVTGGWRAYKAGPAAAGKDTREVPKEPTREPAREPARVAKAEPEKPRFDFYKVLPGGEEPKLPAPAKVPDRAAADRAAGKAPESKGAEPAAREGGDKVAAVAPRAPATPDRFWLQAGSFAVEADAENLKARLALAGWEAAVQSGTVPDKGVRYRVRLGPYDNVDELNRVKGELARRGFDVAVIRY